MKNYYQNNNKILSVFHIFFRLIKNLYKILRISKEKNALNIIIHFNKVILKVLINK